MSNGNCAFHGDPAVKEKFVNRLRAHRRLEHLTQGTGWDGAKGCAVGCTLERYDHAQYPIELGLPVWLAYLEDRIFAALPKAEAGQFAEDFLAVIPVGADVTGVTNRLAALRMEKLLTLLAGNKEPYAEQCRAAIIGVRQLCLRDVSDAARASAAREAAEAARAAFEAARAAAAREAARAEAAREAARAAWEAAWAAGGAARAVEAANGAAAAARAAARAAAEAEAEAARAAAAAAEAEAEQAEAAAMAWSWYEGNAAQDHWRWEARTLLRLLSECPGSEKGGAA